MTTLNYPEDFLRIVNNKEAPKRDNGFIIVLTGPDSFTLKPAQELLDNRELQTWNTCYSVRYSVDMTGPLIPSIIGRLIQDLGGFLQMSKGKDERIVGSFMPDSIERWATIRKRIRWNGAEDFLPFNQNVLEKLFGLLEERIRVGERLLVFCEVKGNLTLEDLRFDDHFDLLRRLPKRLGIVLCGVDTRAIPDQLKDVVYTVHTPRNYLHLQPPSGESSQPMKGDKATGEDTIGILNEVKALADAIALRDMEPPFVMGVMGGWGSGKSFVLELLKKRLLEIRKHDLSDGTIRHFNPHVGHYYTVWFDAWTYAKAELWASLMQQILLDLNDQIASEQAQAGEAEEIGRRRFAFRNRMLMGFEELLSTKPVMDEDFLASWKASMIRMDELAQLVDLEISEAQSGSQEMDLLSFQPGTMDLGVDAPLGDNWRSELREYVTNKWVENQPEPESGDRMDGARPLPAFNKLNDAQWSLFRHQMPAEKEGILFDLIVREEESTLFKQLEAPRSDEGDVEDDLSEKRKKLRSIRAQEVISSYSRSQRDKEEWIEEQRHELLESHFSKILSGQDGFSFTPLDDFNRNEELKQDSAAVQGMMEHLDNDIMWKRLIGFSPGVEEAVSRQERELQSLRDKLRDKDVQIEKQVDLRLKKVRVQNYLRSFPGILGKELLRRVEKLSAEESRSDESEAAVYQEASASVSYLSKILAGLRGQDLLIIALSALGAVGLYLVDQGILTAIPIVAGLASTALDAIRRSTQWLEERVPDFQRFASGLQDQQQSERDRLISMEKRNKDYQETEDAVKEQESTLMAYKRKQGMLASHPTLRDYIMNRLEDKEYEQQLGMLHRIQQDIRELSLGLLSKPLSREGRDLSKVLFPRGKPRIMLFIDDLDRCPPEKVVEVLEAAQLLVKTDLFVVVIAMDIRYVTRALEHQYRGVLERDGRPSGLDYIEKIVQLPYRVRSISSEGMHEYLRSQMELEGAPGDVPVTNDVKGGGNAFDSLMLEMHPPSEVDTRIVGALPQQVLKFKQEDLDLMHVCASRMDISPRASKRLVNVMKLMKIIWFHDGEEQVGKESKQAVVFLLTASARFPQLLKRVLTELQEKWATYKNEPRLHTVINRIIREWQNKEYHPEDWLTFKLLSDEKELMPRTLTFSEFGLRNITLVRSFSFVGEVDAPEVRVHKLSLAEPVTVQGSQKNGVNGKLSAS